MGVNGCSPLGYLFRINFTAPPQDNLDHRNRYLTDLVPGRRACAPTQIPISLTYSSIPLSRDRIHQLLRHIKVSRH